MTLSIPAWSQQAQSASGSATTVPQPENKEGKAKKKEELQEVVVTGSNIKENISDISVRGPGLAADCPQ